MRQFVYVCYYYTLKLQGPILIKFTMNTCTLILWVNTQPRFFSHSLFQIIYHLIINHRKKLHIKCDLKKLIFTSIIYKQTKRKSFGGKRTFPKARTQSIKTVRSLISNRRKRQQLVKVKMSLNTISYVLQPRERRRRLCDVNRRGALVSSDTFRIIDGSTVTEIC